MMRCPKLAVALAFLNLFVWACNDPVLPVASENRPALVNQTDAFRYEAFDLQNVHDTLRWTWQNTGPVAAVIHASFIPHGESALIVRDADGTEVYNGPLESPQDETLTRDTDAGRPGAWTIEARLYGLDGARIDFRVERLQEHHETVEEEEAEEE
jgi:hypothetical protein